MTQVKPVWWKKELVLPDGSQIVLNACSQLQYPTEFVGNIRDVQLNGEAYFKITSDPQKPFQVQTAAFQIEVLGTEFNVKSYPHDQIQSVEVEEGKVQVKLPEDRIRLKSRNKSTWIDNPANTASSKDVKTKWLNGEKDRCISIRPHWLMLQENWNADTTAAFLFEKGNHSIIWFPVNMIIRTWKQF